MVNVARRGGPRAARPLEDYPRSRVHSTLLRDDLLSDGLEAEREGLLEDCILDTTGLEVLGEDCLSDAIEEPYCPAISREYTADLSAVNRSVRR